MKDIHANPQFRRAHTLCLNGEWDFEILSSPFGDGLSERELKGKIIVPYCPESELSGIGYTDFIYYCAYAKRFSLSKSDLSGRVLLRFGACDYEAFVYVNGERVGSHRGGYSSFCFDVTRFVSEGENRIFVLVYDDVADDCPSGKQTFKKHSYGCFYTRVTGIWQSVWLEFVPNHYIKNVRFTPNAKRGTLSVRADCAGEEDFSVEVSYEGRRVGSASARIIQYGDLECALSEKHLWEPGKGRLYDVKLRFGEDEVYSYFGLRDCGFEGKRFMINGKCVFQRFVLDQGYHPKGLYTVPTEEEMREEIAMATDLGFNGARLHQKAFEPQFLYECDRAGFMVWGELPSWGIDYTDLSNVGAALDEWRELIERDGNHPSIVLWCPANEFWTDEFRGNEYIRLCDLRYVKLLYEFTKILDPTRPCVDSSGGYHIAETDLYDFHTYQGAEDTRIYLSKFEREKKLDIPLLMPPRKECRAAEFGGQPVMASEFGGISYCPSSEGWGYSAASSSEELAERVAELCSLYMDSPEISGMCYTQLYDIEQEVNGLYYADRRPKLKEKDKEIVRAVLARRAKIEEVQ